jgi:hypothetical protein
MFPAVEGGPLDPDGPDLCGEFRKGVRAIERELVVGDIECLCGDFPVSAFIDFMDQYKAVTGEKLPFFRRRVDASYAGDAQRWPAFASATTPTAMRGSRPAARPGSPGAP